MNKEQKRKEIERFLDELVILERMYGKRKELNTNRTYKEYFSQQELLNNYDRLFPESKIVLPSTVNEDNHDEVLIWIRTLLLICEYRGATYEQFDLKDIKCCPIEVAKNNFCEIERRTSIEFTDGPANSDPLECILISHTNTELTVEFFKGSGVSYDHLPDCISYYLNKEELHDNEHAIAFTDIIIKLGYSVNMEFISSTPGLSCILRHRNPYTSNYLGGI